MTKCSVHETLCPRLPDTGSGWLAICVGYLQLCFSLLQSSVLSSALPIEESQDGRQRRQSQPWIVSEWTEVRPQPRGVG